MLTDHHCSLTHNLNPTVYVFEFLEFTEIQDF